MDEFQGRIPLSAGFYGMMKFYDALMALSNNAKLLIFLVLWLNAVFRPNANILLIKNSVFVIIYTNPYPHLLLPSEDPTAATAEGWRSLGSG